MSSMIPTPEQHAIIQHPLEPLRVSAGAGTGKTTTVALRMAHLIERTPIDPERVLGITFTNKAAAEMRERLERLLDEIGKHFFIENTGFTPLKTLFAHHRGVLARRTEGAACWNGMSR